MIAEEWAVRALARGRITPDENPGCAPQKANAAVHFAPGAYAPIFALHRASFEDLTAERESQGPSANPARRLC